MPSDLFGSVSSRRAASRSRRPSLLFISAIGHLVVFLLIIVASLRATGPLPEPRARVTFTSEARIVRMTDAPRRLPRHTAPASSVAAPTLSIPAIDLLRDTRAPVEAPPTIGADSQDPGGAALVALGGPPRIGVADWGPSVMARASDLFNAWARRRRRIASLDGLHPVSGNR